MTQRAKRSVLDGSECLTPALYNHQHGTERTLMNLYSSYSRKRSVSDIRGFEPTEMGGGQMAAQKKRRVTRSRADLSARSPFVARRRRPLIRIVSRRRNRIYDAIPLLKFKLEPAVPATRAQNLSDFGTFKTKKSRKLKRRPKYTPAQHAYPME